MERVPKGSQYTEQGNTHETNVEVVMQNTKELLAGIVQQMAEKIRAGEYGVVLGIDASGRVPALILHDIMNRSGKAELRFLAGEKGLFADNADKEGLLEAYFNTDLFQDLQGQGKKVLLVEDIVASADSIRNICEAMRDNNVEFDIAALHVDGKTTPEHLEEYLDTHMFHGNRSYPHIYGKTQMSGVRKNRREMHARPVNAFSSTAENLIPSYDDGETSLKSQDREVLQYTRQRVREIADELAAEYGID